MTTQHPAPAEHPAAGAGPTPDEAAWIRAHAWTAAMRKTHRTVPRLTTRCACQYGPTSQCRGGRHDQCRRAAPLPMCATYICAVGGETVLHHPTPYEHPTPTATGPHRTHAAQVWLADRVCRWVCPCGCHTAPATPKPAPKPVQGVLLFEVGP